MPMGGFNGVGMPEKETRETFGYLLEELENLEVAYVSLMRTPSADPELTAAYDCVAHFLSALEERPPIRWRRCMYPFNIPEVSRANGLFENYS